MQTDKICEHQRNYTNKLQYLQTICDRCSNKRTLDQAEAFKQDVIQVNIRITL